MGLEMIERQELALELCFGPVNLLLAKTSYYIQHNQIVYALANRAKAGLAESSAEGDYTRIVSAEAKKDAQIDPAFPNDVSAMMEWQNRIATDQAVVLVTAINLKTCLSSGSSPEKVESKWRHSRAKSILKADMAAFKAAWPGVKI
eukprot:gene27055-33721_t